MLNLSSSNFKLDVSITDADNNNDGVTDTDYLYRIHGEGGGVVVPWTTWSAILPIIDFDSGAISSGDYNVTIEVRNMYGTTSETLIIHYTVPTTADAIPGYSTTLTVLALLGASIVILLYRKKSNN